MPVGARNFRAERHQHYYWHGRHFDRDGREQQRARLSENGITENEVGTTVTVRANQVRGHGPTTGAAENGIQIADGAAGEVTNNSVIDEIYSPCGSTTDCAAIASGILVFDSQGISVTRNHVGNTQGGA
jgi:hypothetical protein